MLHDKLPKIVKPRKLCHLGAQQEVKLVGYLLLENLGKLNDKIKSPQSQVYLELRFGLDESGYCQIRVQGRMQLEYVCQRCLQALEETLSFDSLLSPVAGDNEAKALPPNFEPLIAVDDEVDLQHWVQEEILLGVPIVPRHDFACNAVMNEIKQVEPVASVPLSPFASLKAQLKR